MKKARAPDLTEELLRIVIDTIDAWKGKLTWDTLIGAVEAATGHRYSRFTFAEYPQVADAFALKKDALRGTWTGEPSQPKDARVRAAIEQADRYRFKVERLESENQLLLEQFVTWAVNAERKGVTMDMLNAPLPKPDRDRSKEVK